MLRRFRSWNWNVAIRVALIFIMYYVVSAVVLDEFMKRWEFRSDKTRFGFAAIVNYEAHRPWAYRILTPALVNGAAEMFPDSYVEAHRDFLVHESGVIQYAKDKNSANWTLDLVLKYHLTYVWVFVTLFFGQWATRYATRLIFPHADIMADILPAVAYLLLPLTFLHGGYMYDFPELLFFGLAICAALSGRYWLYYPIFVLAILNKETGVLLVLFFLPLAMDKLRRLTLCLHVATQIVIGGAIIVAVRQYFANSPGVPTEFHLWQNLTFYSNPEVLWRLMTAYANGIPVPRTFHAINIAAIALLLAYDWKAKLPSLKLMLYLTAAVMIPLSLTFGYRDEIRNLSYLFPPFYFLSAHTAIQVYRKTEVVQQI